jgi:1,4-alpha-glucan branching enzyme
MRFLIQTYLFFFLVQFAAAQKSPFRVEENKMILTLDRKWTDSQVSEILQQFDMKALNADSAFRFLSAGALAADGWMVRKKGHNRIEVYKPIHHSQGLDMLDIPVCIDQSFPDDASMDEQNQYTNRIFGYNVFEAFSVVELENGLTEFQLETKSKVKEVYLSGTFNNWSTGALPMARNGDKWIARVRLNPGRHEYKFIVDGSWRPDPRNEIRLADGYLGFNSVYFKSNTKFYLKGYAQAKRVVLTGTFNDWNEKATELRKTADGWALDAFLPDGTYYYKFIIDGEWITDPANPQVREDANGNRNSLISVGNPTRFQLKNFENAKQVVLTGTFNGWNEGELLMSKAPDQTWITEFVLNPGNYAYKYIVDGRWICDPSKPMIPNEFATDMNNLLVVDPNFTFRIEHLENARSVFVTGNFIDWSEPGFPLTKGDGFWELPLHLKNGKVLYKFIVDGDYMLDPANSLYEENEFGTGNSFMWIE